MPWTSRIAGPSRANFSAMEPSRDRRKRVRLAKNTLKYNPCRVSINLSRDFHCPAILMNDHHIRNAYNSDFEIYHYGCIDEDRRKERVAKYKKCDPYNKYQKCGYDYILDETGLEVAKVDGWDG